MCPGHVAEGQVGTEIAMENERLQNCVQESWPRHLQCLCGDFLLILVSLPPQPCELESGEEGMGGRNFTRSA